MPRILAAVLAAALSFLALPAGAEVGDARRSGVHQHDGLFLQAQVGLAHLNVDFTQGGYDLSASGVGIGQSGAVGWTPIENLVVFGEVVVQMAVSPTLEIEDMESYGTDDAASLSFITLGPGVAYYFGESSFFLKGSVGWANANIYDYGDILDANGIGFRVGGGKEWWIANQWGLGFGANFFRAAMTDNASATSFAANFSVTFH